MASSTNARGVLSRQRSSAAEQKPRINPIAVVAGTSPHLGERDEYARSGSKRDAGAERQHAKTEPTQSTSGLINDLQASALGLSGPYPSKDEIEIFAEPTADRGLRSRSLLVFVEGPFRRVHLVDFFFRLGAR